jgi:hypothetical protein
MTFGPASDDGDDARRPQFRALLNCPFHAVELEDRESDGYIRDGGGRNFFPQFELHPAFLNANYPSATDTHTGGDIEFLPYAGAENARKMLGVASGESGMIAGDFVGHPAAAGHEPQSLNHEGHQGTQRKEHPLGSELPSFVLLRVLLGQ